MKIFRIETDLEGFFVKYLLVVNSILGLNKQALKVFAQLLYWNNKYKGLSKEDRSALVFSTDIRKKIIERLGITKASLDCQFSNLRKKGVIQDNTINPVYEIFYDTHRDLGFFFRIKEDEEPEG